MTFYFSLNVSFHEFQRYYQGHVDKVEVHDSHGRKLWINGRHFRRFLTRSGVHGNFKLELTEKGELLSLQKI
ncbi:DUF2835 family protein [Shewanella canadensis]|uniref:DUF2835 family protein n=1 Tax=Shewanella canadensis TaxID=271096 RepID=A0A431WWG4_9GAMM|nr:DUF2835 domain-containing protein [Shewanella canadensis]RTR39772.1 DUF2835 family protein [Shewanella canadensis]